ncbi:ATP-binding protein [Micromonospora sp. NPDC018662]|uniref:ATP-binding protein n=1 Tax=Micromonospora sp. NPDC018662 TaxID=3364238 RepID=UPI0037AB40E7
MLAADETLFLAERIELAIKIGESHFREFKSAIDGAPGNKSARPLSSVMQDVGRTCVAFANSDGGELLIGVEDDGSVTGVPYDKEKIQLLLNADKTHVHTDTPLPPPRKTVVTIDGKQVVYFYVPKGTQYVYLTADGRCVKRLDRESVPISVEKIQGERLEDASRDYDRSFSWPQATISDLDVDLIQSVASQVAYGISPEKCLQYLDLAEFTPNGLRLTNAALLLFAKDIRRWHPRCQVRITSYRGSDAQSGSEFNVLKDDTIAGNILSLTDTAWERVQVAISQQTTLTESARFEQTYLYPQIACREALINAIVHRNYAIEGRGIEISLFNDRMEIKSPGQLLSTVSLADLRSLKGVHESRNPLIARVLREVGLVREMGEGIRRIFEVMKSSALATPELANDSSGFLVKLFSRSMYSDEIQLWLSNFEHMKLDESQRAVLALGYGGREFSTQDVIDRLGLVDIDLVREILTPLRGMKFIERSASDYKLMQQAKRMGVPKRQIPSFRVVIPGAPSASTIKSPLRAEAVEVSHDAPDAEGSLPSTDTTEIYLGNLPYAATEHQLSEVVGQHCDVESIKFPGRNASGNGGFAFVVISPSTALRRVIEKLDGVDLAGRRMRAQIPRKISGSRMP